MSAGPCLLARSWSGEAQDGARHHLPAGTRIVGWPHPSQVVALIDGDEVRVTGAEWPAATECCAMCLKWNGIYRAADCETAGVQTCSHCAPVADGMERHAIKHRRQLAHEGAADGLNAQRKDER